MQNSDETQTMFRTMVQNSPLSSGLGGFTVTRKSTLWVIWLIEIDAIRNTTSVKILHKEFFLEDATMAILMAESL